MASDGHEVEETTGNYLFKSVRVPLKISRSHNTPKKKKIPINQ